MQKIRAEIQQVLPVRARVRARGRDRGRDRARVRDRVRVRRSAPRFSRC